MKFETKILMNQSLENQNNLKVIKKWYLKFVKLQNKQLIDNISFSFITKSDT